MAKRKNQETTKGTAKPRAYTVFFQRESNGVYTAHIPALQVVTEGKTLEEAKEMASDAIAGWIEAARKVGKPIPDDVPTAHLEVAR